VNQAIEEARALLKLDAKMPSRSVLKRLRDQRNAIHPDKTGGKFENPRTEQLYHKLSDLIKRVEARNVPRAVTVGSRNLAVIEANTEIMRSIADEAKKAREHQVAVEIKKELDAARIDLAASSALPFHRAKFGLWGAGAVSGTLLALKEPILAISEYTSTYVPSVTIVFASLSVALVILGFLSHSIEQAEKARARQLLTSGGIRSLLFFMNKDHALYRDEISVDDFNAAISQLIRAADASVIEEAGKAVVAQLLQQGLISLSDKKSVSPAYLTSEELRDEAFRGERDWHYMRRAIGGSFQLILRG
jgi:hypothetical protein